MLKEEYYLEKSNSASQVGRTYHRTFNAHIGSFHPSPSSLRSEESIRHTYIAKVKAHPQFNRETLPNALSSAGIAYVHASGLGGFRHAIRNSPNTGWKNVSFRGFADYMQTQEFDENLQTVVNMVMQEQITLMCAEAVPWRCHRLLIADALLVRGIQVEHILSETSHKPHKLTSWVQVKDTKIIYPPSKQSSQSEEDTTSNRSPKSKR